MKTPTIKEISAGSRTQRWGYEFILDFLANYVAKLALFLRIRPLQLTLFWVIVQGLTPLLFLRGEYAYFVLGTAIFQFMFIVDLSDGKLFRFQNVPGEHKKPLFPKYVDRVGHFLNNSLLFLFLGIGVYLRFGDALYFYLGLLAVFFYLLNKAITVNPAWYKSPEEKEVVGAVMWKAVPRSGESKIKQFFFDVLRVEHLGNVFFFGIVFDKPQYVLFVYVIAYFLEFVRKLVVQGRLLVREDKTEVKK